MDRGDDRHLEMNARIRCALHGPERHDHAALALIDGIEAAEKADDCDDCGTDHAADGEFRFSYGDFLSWWVS
ncbi:hypothetical protein [Pseudogemmobacter hezensis]|uniref:hypothetical protein n=1 Tax=Pseudogemmobacter hezensis TaxID=2737662 RepID=UPI0034599DD0